MTVYEAYITWKNTKGRRWTTPCPEAFIGVFNAGAEAVNPYFETWNGLYDEEYPDKKGTIADKTYYKFIARKATEVLESLGSFRIGLKRYHLEWRWDEDEQTSLMCVVCGDNVGTQLLKPLEVPD